MRGRWQKTERTPGVYRWTGPTPRGQARWMAVWRDPAGRQKSKTFSRFEGARAHRTKMLATRQEGRYIAPEAGKVSLSEAMDLFLETRRDLEDNTRALYEDRAALVRASAIARLPINRIGREQIAGFLNDLQENRTWRKGVTGLATVDQTRRFLHSVFEWAVDEERIPKNPARGIKTKKAVRVSPRVLDEAEVDRVADAIEPRYRALIHLLSWMGLRIGEAAALRVGHIDFHRGWVTVEASVKEVRGQLIFGSTKTDDIRSFPLPDWLLDELKAHVVEHSSDPAALVFTSPEGQPLRPNNWRKRHFYAACARAGIAPPPKVHHLRHTAASLMARAGFSPTEAQAILGHGSVSMTLHYTHKYQSGLQEKARAFGADHRSGSDRVVRLPPVQEPSTGHTVARVGQ